MSPCVSLHRSSLVLLTALITTLSCGLAAAQQPEDAPPTEDGPSTEVAAPDTPVEAGPSADELYATAVAAFDKRQWAAAAEAFAAALQKDRSPVLAYNAGRANEYTGNLELAEKFYLEALELKPDGELRKLLYDTLERLANVRTKVAGKEDDIGLIEVATKPDGATVLINGERVGVSPYQSAYPAGSFKVEVELEGYVPFAQEIVVEPGKEVVVSAKLFEEGRLWTWVTLGSGVALVGGGVVLGRIAEDRLDKAKSAQGKRRSPSSYEDLKAEGENAAIGSLILYSVGAAALVGSVVVYFLEGQSDDGQAIKGVGESRETSGIHIFGGPGFVGVGGSF